MNIVFMGTPAFAIPSLKALIDAGHNIKAIYTQPDKRKGKSKTPTPPPVKEFAIDLDNEIEIVQPVSLRTQEEFDKFASFEPDLCVVVAYGKILPKSFLDFPKHGCINVHGSLLPLYRGAAPIQWSIINGDKKTGVSIMYMSEGLDEGDIILKSEIDIDPEDTSESMHIKLSEVGSKTLLDTIELIKSGQVSRIKQSDTGIEPTFAPPLRKEMGLLDFEMNADEIESRIRGLHPWPNAFTKYNGKTLKIYRAKVVYLEQDYPDIALCDMKTGSLISDKRFIIKCGNNTGLEIIELQLEGKKRVNAQEFFNGYRLKTGVLFGE